MPFESRRALSEPLSFLAEEGNCWKEDDLEEDRAERKPDTTYIIFWSDVQILNGQTEEDTKVDMMIEEIWATYFLKSNLPLPISVETYQSLHLSISEGRPYPRNIFNRAGAEVYEHLRWEFTVPEFINSCIQSSIYQKRLTGSGEIVEDAFLAFKKRFQEQSWKVYREIDDVTIWRRNRFGKSSWSSSWRESLPMNIGPKEVANLIFSRFERMPEWNRSITSVELMEEIHSQTHICRLIMSSQNPFSKKRDMIVLRALHTLPDRSIVIMECNVDGNFAEDRRYKRSQFELGGFLILPRGPEHCEVISIRSQSKSTALRKLRSNPRGERLQLLKKILIDGTSLP